MNRPNAGRTAVREPAPPLESPPVASPHIAVISLRDQHTVGLSFRRGEAWSVERCVRADRLGGDDLSLIFAEIRTALEIGTDTTVGIVADLTHGTVTRDPMETAREIANASNCFMLSSGDIDAGVTAELHAVEVLVEAAQGAGLQVARVDLADHATTMSERSRLGRRGFRRLELESQLYVSQQLTADDLSPLIGTFRSLDNRRRACDLRPGYATTVAPDGLNAGQVGWAIASMPAPIAPGAPRGPASVTALRRLAVVLVLIGIALATTLVAF